VLPNVPTVAESGVAGFDAPVWWGVLAPAKLPPDLVDRLYKDLVAALRQPEVTARLRSLGAEPVGSSPAEFDAYLHAEADRWGPVLKAADIKVQ